MVLPVSPKKTWAEHLTPTGSTLMAVDHSDPSMSSAMWQLCVCACAIQLGHKCKLLVFIFGSLYNVHKSVVRVLQVAGIAESYKALLV